MRLPEATRDLVMVWLSSAFGCQSVPGAKVLKVDTHDWNLDPYSLSTWMAFRPGQITRFGTGLRHPEGW